VRRWPTLGRQARDSYQRTESPLQNEEPGNQGRHPPDPDRDRHAP